MRSSERAQELGEVFTNKREVDSMLDLVPDMFESVDSTFLEPACGHGNFLVEILLRKIRVITKDEFGDDEGWYEFGLARAVASIFAVDISEQNVHEARERLFRIVQEALAAKGRTGSRAFDSAIHELLSTNILLGDSLESADQILFVEYKPLPGQRFQRKPFYLEQPEVDLFYQPPLPLETVYYLQLGGVK